MNLFFLTLPQSPMNILTGKHYCISSFGFIIKVGPTYSRNLILTMLEVLDPPRQSLQHLDIRRRSYRSVTIVVFFLYNYCLYCFIFKRWESCTCLFKKIPVHYKGYSRAQLRTKTNGAMWRSEALMSRFTSISSFCLEQVRSQVSGAPFS